ncbi:TIGR03087 family PEP-CTERM/XrtA system glycosyltransferase [Thalassomonas sp. M1454]|uniref:TIGR03087 family PEP-CTERM/XrtA system glycosyltransferase n=1 Tax=Thalassomonas sp. M1454 TaxID=2594477 RepID=UPI00163D68B1|nr:TIGR03087 family PEP-CTERM/XrtA system glycosyltransferase [Thalassomonas sp. M1454]
MNILFITQRVPYPPNKGDKIRTYNQLLHLYQRGHHITVACPVDSDSEYNYLNKVIKIINAGTLFGTSLPFIVKAIYSLLTNKPFSICHFFSPQLKRKIDNNLHQYDLIMCSSSSVVEYLFQNKKFNDFGKVIVDFMDLDSDKWKQYRDATTGIKKWIYHREYKLLQSYESNIQGKVKYCLFTSTKEVQIFKKDLAPTQNKDNLIHIGNGLDYSYFRPVNKPFDVKYCQFIFTGVMDYTPNIDAVTWFCSAIWPQIINYAPHAKFFIAGMNPTPKVKALANLKGVEVTGFVEDIRDYYKQADFFVAPLRIARGVQNKVLEAFACKLPVVTTPNAIQGIECEPEEHCLQASSADEFISQIQRLIADKELRERLSNNALQLIVDKYSWEGQLQKLDKLINNDLTKEKKIL